ncbi:uncharacterized protein B0I36DRAFT_353534 [Microdochium trichocladiopsis]|uniref:Uncharacterized protein n=1 Tax=Microdochium trichocladiopsis TaxID=1682393 RepID=A0A9P8XXE6_9PEZI|nr:uncharacterized protein B0I36DRAFT_353534 [Microdochium trichocladiopsis]KAH7020790.1 hypothetical protein B0I36DRAFT_353534 [Microdochium trichocladiopsis]
MVATLHIATALAGLLATVGAIDVRYYTTPGTGNTITCNGGYSQCTGLSPDVCCYYSGSRTVAFAAIPTEWRIQARFYGGENCSGEQRNDYSNGRDNICWALNGIYVKGAGYGFVNKRSEAEITAATGAGNKKCVRPDLLVFETGESYQLDTLTESQYAEMLCDVNYADLIFPTYSTSIHMAGGNATDVPASFSAFRR